MLYSGSEIKSGGKGMTNVMGNEEFAIRRELQETSEILKKYDNKAYEYEYIRNLIEKDRKEKMQRLREIEKERGY